MNSQRRFPNISIALSLLLLCGQSAIGQTPTRQSVERDARVRNSSSRQQAVQQEQPRPATTTTAVASETAEPNKESREEQERAEQEREKREDTDGRTDDPAGALRFRHLQMQDEHGYIPPDGLEKARQHVKLMKLEQQKRLKAQQQQQQSAQGGQDSQVGILAAGVQPDSWTWLGPGNVGGRIRSIVIDPRNTNNMWVGSVGGGIWATQNGENPRATWFPVNDFLANLAVSTMVINPATPSIMYAGTGEGFGNGDALQGAGVFQSTDTGVTWNQLASTNPAAPVPAGCGVGAAPCPAFWTFVNRLAISPNGGTILAATSQAVDANNFIIDNGGIARSTDGGATWTQEMNTQAFDVDFQPASNTQAVAGGEGVVMFRRVSPAGVVTWANAILNPVIAAQPAAPTQTVRRRVEVAYAPSAPTTVYVLVNQYQNTITAGVGNYQGEIYRSTNAGQNFTRMTPSGNNFFNGAGGNQGWYDNALWVNPQDATFIIVGGIWLWRSTDSGATFTQISNGVLLADGTASPHADNHIIVSHPGFNNSTNQRVFVGNDGGIYRTDVVRTANTFNGWGELNNNLGITQLYGAAGNPASGVIVGGAQDNGTQRFTGNTEGWTQMNGSDGGYCAADQTDPNFFYGESQNLGVVRSTNAGQSASPINAGISDSGITNAANFIAPLILDPNDPNTLLAGGINLWRSQDAKAAIPTWTAIQTPTGGADQRISAIAVSPVTSSLILVGHNDGRIFRTFNGTAPSPVWTQLNTPVLGRIVTRLVIDSTTHATNSNWYYATFGGFNANNVYRSTDNGATWTSISGTGTSALPAVPVRTLAFHPVDSSLLYVGTEIGIFTSNDAGATWEPTQDGPANVSVDELFWMGGDLIAATHGRGLYRASGGAYVKCDVPVSGDGTLGRPFKTVLEAVNATTKYRSIWVLPSRCREQLRINKRLELRTVGGTAVIGP